MELRHLRYAVTVADEGNFTHAAKRLGVAQPPLSRQIRDLEVELGNPLFDRNSRPIRLTEAGRIFYEQASQILAGVEQLRRSMHSIAHTDRRRFVIGFVGSVIYGPMPRLVRRFRTAAPLVEVQLVEMTTLEQVAALKDGRIDAGVGRLRIDDPAVRRELLHLEPLVAAIASDHALAQSSDAISLTVLAAEPLIVYPSQPRPSYADQVLQIFRDHGLQPLHVSEVREVQTALGLVAAQSGVAIVPEALRRLQRDDVVYRPILESDAVSPIIMSFRIGDISREARFLEQICAEMYGPDPRRNRGI
jgi:DNA-binding transcriptional LysR family regulator